MDLAACTPVPCGDAAIMIRAFGSSAFSGGTAFCTDGYAGTALWLSPSARVPTKKRLVRCSRGTGARSLAPRNNGHIRANGHVPARPTHTWYLPLIGVDPAHQGEGHGDALMAYALARCDLDRAPAYLESSNPRNIPFYRRYGFEPLGAIQVGSSPTLVPMLRRAR